MRCKKHYTDLSSIVGVCACCLRERLLSVIAAQEQQNQTQPQIHIHATTCSVSPYIRNRKVNNSDSVSAWSDINFHTDHPHQHHHPSVPRHRHTVSDQTPDIRHTSDNTNTNTNVNSNKKLGFIRLLPFANLFRQRNRKSVDSVPDPVSYLGSDLVFEPNGRDPSLHHQHCVGANPTSSPSWFSIIGKRRKKHAVYDDGSKDTVTDGSVKRQTYCRDRGMSPVRNSDVGVGDFNDLNNNVMNGYESTTESWKNTPRRTPARRGVHGRNKSSLTVCLSPLVRASPNRKWNKNGVMPDNMFSGEIRGPVKDCLANAKGFHANRSRKLVDHGRRNQNR